MARIVGVNIPDNKQVLISLQHIFGIGHTRAMAICDKANINTQMKVIELSEDQLNTLRTLVSAYEVEGDLRRKITLDIKHLTDIGSYRGMRHRRRLPVRGQRTRTNARTRKGPKRPMRA